MNEGENTEANISGKTKVTNVNFKDQIFFNIINDPSNKSYPMIRFSFIYFFNLI